MVNEITIQNLYKRTLSYELKSEINSQSKSWDVSLDETQVVVEPKESKTIVLIVKPTIYVKSDDWAEVKLVVKPMNKKKSAEISTVTSIKDADLKLSISGVLHWPRVFKKGDKVETSFKLINRGNVSTYSRW